MALQLASTSTMHGFEAVTMLFNAAHAFSDMQTRLEEMACIGHAWQTLHVGHVGKGALLLLKWSTSHQHVMHIFTVGIRLCCEHSLQRTSFAACTSWQKRNRRHVAVLRKAAGRFGCMSAGRGAGAVLDGQPCNDDVLVFAHCCAWNACQRVLNSVACMAQGAAT